MTQSLTQIPTPLQRQIFTCCEAPEALRVSHCCKALKALIDSPEMGRATLRIECRQIRQYLGYEVPELGYLPGTYSMQIFRVNAHWGHWLSLTHTKVRSGQLSSHDAEVNRQHMAIRTLVLTEPLWRVDAVLSNAVVPKPLEACLYETVRAERWRLVRVLIRHWVQHEVKDGMPEQRLIRDLVLFLRHASPYESDYLGALRQSGEPRLVSWARETGLSLMRPA
jgi:hypothetical protein